ncbi:MAG: septal ring lytic transglycosylase RlpA family protein [Oscillatoriales cyanobacterium]|jgi:rare lipoprotein A (peptidoglycan hydrolase)|nr:MAG: septal ring lytic transglycosylase RlpA family protein [Oscillatoriales cyanobacterium]
MNEHFWSGAIAAIFVSVPMQIATASTVDPSNGAEFESTTDRPTLVSLDNRESPVSAEAAPLLARITETASQQASPDIPPLQHPSQFMLDSSGNLAYVDQSDNSDNTPAPEEIVYQAGEASWYGPGFDGNYTASGEVFNQYDISAAHPTLPFNTIVRVTNVDNGRSLDVRINDRGPFSGHRILDLSRGAAEELGVVSTGVAYVEISIVE